MDSISKEQAARLWDELKGNLLAVEDGIKQIIATKAWEPLGYETFQDAWEDRLSDVKLTGVMRATVVLAMFEQGATEVEVATTVTGVGPVRSKAYKQAHQAKLTPKKAELHAEKMVPVKPYARSLPERRNALRIEGFDDDEIQAWNALADELGVDRNELLREALREGMKEWGGLHAVAV